MQKDRLGLPLSTSAPAAAQAYRGGVELLLSAFPGAEACFERAVAHDPGFALAHAALGRMHQIYARGSQARACIERAQREVAHASARERAHVTILGWSIGGEGERALQALLEHVEEFPRDALVLSLALGAFGLYAFSGRADHDQARLALCERLAPGYGDDWWFLTYLGWSHTEAGNLTQGRLIAERALAQRAANAHAAHALAHSFEECREPAAGEAFLRGWLGSYAPSGLLYGHLQWHMALWRLSYGDIEGALGIYMEHLQPERHRGPPINVISDAASLLWRLGLLGLKSSEVQALADYAARGYPGRAHHFIEWHLAMVAAATGLPRSLEPASGPLGGVLRAVCEGFGAFGLRDYAGALRLLEPAAREFVRLGGSGAQRRVLEDTIAAARRLREG
jgi:Tfp pilus assembly protein PilF